MMISTGILRFLKPVSIVDKVNWLIPGIGLFEKIE